MDPLDAFARRPKVLLIIGAVVVLAIFLQGYFSLFSTDTIVDTYVYYFGAKAMALGLNLYDAELLDQMGKKAGVNEVYLYWHTPFSAAFFVPLLYFPPQTVHRLLMCWNAALLGLLFYLIYILVRPQRHAHALFALFLLIQIINGPAVTTLRIGQSNFLILILMLGCLYAHLRGKDSLSALPLAAAILIKITPGILLLYFLLFYARRWRYLGWIGLWMVVLIVATLPWAPPRYWLDYLPYALHGPQIQAPYSIWGWLETHRSIYPFLESARVWIYLALALPFTAITLLSMARIPAAHRASYSLAVLILLSLLVSPLTWHHHFLFALFPLYYFLAGHWDRGEVFHCLILGLLCFIVLARAPHAYLIARSLGVAALLLLEIIPRLQINRSVRAELSPA
jgi:hypothetical protein